jgi:hypothetical protein
LKLSEKGRVVHEPAELPCEVPGIAGLEEQTNAFVGYEFAHPSET